MLGRGALFGLLGAAALAAFAFAGGGGKPGPGPSGSITIAGQTYFNGLSPSAQRGVLSGLWAWYLSSRTNGTWPQAVGDPGMSSSGDLTDPGNFGITVDAFQTAHGLGSVSGVLDMAVANALGAI